jgi:hypothetical protein
VLTRLADCAGKESSSAVKSWHLTSSWNASSSCSEDRNRSRSSAVRGMASGYRSFAGGFGARGLLPTAGLSDWLGPGRTTQLEHCDKRVSYGWTSAYQGHFCTRMQWPPTV